VTFSFTSSSLMGTKIGTVQLGQFATHGAWVSTVADWAQANLSPSQRGEIVSAAAGIEGLLASNGHGSSHRK
jgi:hypothetical protein